MADSSYVDKRRINYPNYEDLLVALWEKVMEGRGEVADTLEAKRQSVKSENPK